MEGNVILKEISYLTQLIEQHKREIAKNKSSLNKQEVDEKSTNLPLPGKTYVIERQRIGNNSNYSYIKPRDVPHQGRVHFNPNFKPKVPGIHVNPRIGGTRKSSVHVNPKMMKNLSTASNSGKKLPDLTTLKLNSARSNLVGTKIEHSVHVNPKLMKELSSSHIEQNNTKSLEKFNKNPKSESLKSTKLDNRLVIQSKTKIVKNDPSPNHQGIKKSANSNLISLSRRKLVRIRRSSKIGSSISPASLTKVKRLSNSNMRKTKVSTKYKLVMEHVDATGTINPVSRSIKNRQSGLSKYKIDRTHLQKVKRRLSIGKNNTNVLNKKSAGSTTGLVRIGGILYKSSRNQLIRSSNDQQTSKRKRCVINVKGDRFVMASNGKKLRRLNSAVKGSGNSKSPSLVSRVDIGGMTFVEKTPNVLVRANTKNNISTKAKQRSIQILRNKMRKNNQPCLIFQRFGYCTSQVKGTCPKLHDAKQVALCRNFLQGKCFLDNCPMSHSVCPEKMPTCKYFLEGCCIRDHCPYLHVKVSSNTPICSQFLRGYCAEANKCKQRHVYVCPEFERSGNCAKGKYCPYPHKPISTISKKSSKAIERKSPVSKKRVTKINKDSAKSSAPLSSHNEDRKRYYDEAGTPKKELDKKRKTILDNIQIIKGIKLAEINRDDTELLNNDNQTNSVGTNCENNDQSEKDDNSCPKRTPLGTLPAYIPIN